MRALKEVYEKRWSSIWKTELPIKRKLGTAKWISNYDVIEMPIKRTRQETQKKQESVLMTLRNMRIIYVVNQTLF